jgi:hypothetical protein
MRSGKRSINFPTRSIAEAFVCQYVENHEL